MGLRIYAADAPIPRHVVWEYRCDGGHLPSLFAPPAARRFYGEDPAGQASRAGWKETYVDGRRLFLGPCCSGKAPR